MNKIALIIDDCFDTTNMTSFLLKKLGIEKVVIAHNQEDFLKAWSHCKPDLIITDWNIDKDFKGDQIIAEASAHKIPIALVTSEDKESILDKVSELYFEAFAFLQKPLNFSSLKEWLDSIS